MHITAKIRIQVIPEQEDVLWHLSEKCRLVYNFALAERNRNYQENKDRPGKQYIGYVQQANALPKLKEKYPEYKWVYSKVLQTTLKSLDDDFRSFFALRQNGDKGANPPGFKGKDHFCTLRYNQSGFKIERDQIWFSHFYNTVPLIFALPAGSQFINVKQVDLFYDDIKSAYYVSIVHEVQPAQEYRDNGLYQAFDLGVTRHVGVNSHGKFIGFSVARPDKYWKTPIAELQARRDHCKKKSRKWQKLNRLKRKCERKQGNQIKDFQHKLSKKIVENTRANTILVGDLSVKQMPRSRQATPGLNRATQNTGHLSRFIRFLTYKATLAGKRVIKIDEQNTTKACCVCGALHDMPLWKRVIECECGNTMDRDRNSAVNIMVRFLSQNALRTGYRQFADNLRQTGLEIPVHSQEAPCVGGGSPRIWVVP
ncbi:transposase, IS605 OrfB family [Methanoculleus chikugoensis]|uniref:Transposase, IS605 OrfB family n=1 Tax=Methanoculleus chikugoensis TaxID=118126 RepID=A0A1M4MH42_9EURY|nr:RNA-guided endonuclease TnpB family protein [Methanoculleus chikugoensis]SCL74176.1 transposase, IS605 OrfB family [Methanoculleus chikugoensis]